MKNKKLILTAMFAVILSLSLFPVAAFAGGGEEIPLVPEVTEKPKTDTAPLTPDGNLTLVDDVTTETTESKQFVTLVSKNGNYFYLVIDRAGNKENVYFLNLVDEADLLALIEDENPKKTQPPQICTCTDLCENGKADPNCSLCRNDLTKCTGKTTAPTPAPEPKEEKSKNMGGVLLFLITAMIGGGAFYYFKFLKNKPNIKGSTALEEYDFDEDDENAEEECEEEYQSDDDVEESEGDNQ